MGNRGWQFLLAPDFPGGFYEIIDIDDGVSFDKQLAW